MTRPRCLPSCLVLVLAAMTQPVPAADLFDRHTSEHLRTALEKGEAVDRLTMRDGGRLKRLGPSVGGPVVVVRTNDGNLAKAVVAWGFRQADEGLLPVVVLERFVTYRSDRRDASAPPPWTRSGARHPAGRMRARTRDPPIPGATISSSPIAFPLRWTFCGSSRYRRSTESGSGSWC